MKNINILLMLGIISNVTYAQTDSSEFYFKKGIAEKEARRFREAEKHFAKAAGFSPNEAKVQIGWAQALLEQRRYMDAREKYKAAYAIDAKNGEVLEQLATLSLNTRQWADAVTYAKKMQEAKVGNSSNYIIAKSFFEQRNYGECLKYCELAFKEDPKRAETPYIAAHSLVEMSQYKKAAGCFEQAIERDSSKANWMYEAALTFYAIPDDKKAIYWFERAGAKGYPRSSDYLENLANAYLNIKNTEKGLALLKEVEKNKPQDMELLYNIADAYYQTGKYDDAISYWDKALALDKTNANALYMIGLSYQKKGEKEKGQQLCDKAIEMDPKLKNLKEEKKMPGGI
jgi:tetratricopeptide (TPR) repeat protein